MTYTSASDNETADHVPLGAGTGCETTAVDAWNRGIALAGAACGSHTTSLTFALIDDRYETESLVAGLVARAAPGSSLVAIAASIDECSATGLQVDGFRSAEVASADIVDGDVASAAIDAAEAIAERRDRRNDVVVLLVPGGSDCAAAAVDHAATGLPRTTAVIASPVSEPGAVLVHANCDTTRISPHQVIALSLELDAPAAPGAALLSPAALLGFLAGR